jgi:hypothetical protein
MHVHISLATLEKIGLTWPHCEGGEEASALVPDRCITLSASKLFAELNYGTMAMSQEQRISGPESCIQNSFQLSAQFSKMTLWRSFVGVSLQKQHEIRPALLLGFGPLYSLCFFSVPK